MTVHFLLISQGYCGYMLAVHDRFLLPANPNLGLVHHRGKYYAFSTTDAALAFARNPEKLGDTSVVVLPVQFRVCVCVWCS